MKDRIGELLAKILANPSKIEAINKMEAEYYFKFGRFYFSIIRREKSDATYGSYSFYIYPRWNGSVDRLANLMSGPEFDEEAMVSYHSAKFSEEEPIFRNLYDTLRSLFLKVDVVFDELLGKDEEDIPF